MKFVPESTIDAVINSLENMGDDMYQQQMEKFAGEQPVLVAYLFNDENFHLLTEDEKGYLQYLALIAWMANNKVNGPSEAVSEDMIGQAEEQNYALLEASTASRLRDRLDVFFENTTQEDLLAFVEDAVLEDDDNPDSLVTKEGREPIFVAVKTAIDVLTKMTQ